MNQGKTGKIDGIGQYGLCLGKFSYFPNGTSNPVTLTGGLARFISSVTYSATGVQTIVFTSDFGFAGTPRFFTSTVSPSLATSFEASQVGVYDATTRTLVIQQRQAQTGYAAAASANCLVNVMVFVSDSQGK